MEMSATEIQEVDGGVVWSLVGGSFVEYVW